MQPRQSTLRRSFKITKIASLRIKKIRTQSPISNRRFATWTRTIVTMFNTLQPLKRDGCENGVMRHEHTAVDRVAQLTIVTCTNVCHNAITTHKIFRSIFKARPCQSSGFADCSHQKPHSFSAQVSLTHCASTPLLVPPAGSSLPLPNIIVFSPSE